MKPVLTESDFVRAAEALDVPVAAVKAVCQVEAPNGGFLKDGQVAILFERHQFSKRTGGRFDASHPNVSNPVAGGYVGGEGEHIRLAQAVRLDRKAALESCSWGKFQIMGFNYEAAGFDTLQQFINAMSRREGEQLDAFVSFIQKDRGGKTWKALKSSVESLDWAPFACLYNGPAYVKNQYDYKLAKAFRAFS